MSNFELEFDMHTFGMQCSGHRQSRLCRSLLRENSGQIFVQIWILNVCISNSNSKFDISDHLLPKCLFLYVPHVLLYLTQPLHPFQGHFGYGKGGKVTTAWWQVTLCDPIRHVISRSSVVIPITNCYIQLTILTSILYCVWSHYIQIFCYFVFLLCRHFLSMLHICKCRCHYIILCILIYIIIVLPFCIARNVSLVYIVFFYKNHTVNEEWMSIFLTNHGFYITYFVFLRDLNAKKNRTEIKLKQINSKVIFCFLFLFVIVHMELVYIL